MATWLCYLFQETIIEEMEDCKSINDFSVCLENSCKIIYLKQYVHLGKQLNYLTMVNLSRFTPRPSSHYVHQS